MKEIIQDYIDREDSYCKHRLECLVNLTQMYDLVDSNGIHMSKEDSKAFKKVCDLTLLRYSQCPSYLLISDFHNGQLSISITCRHTWGTKHPL